jgi:hypothetical protein
MLVLTVFGGIPELHLGHLFDLSSDDLTMDQEKVRLNQNKSTDHRTIIKVCLLLASLVLPNASKLFRRKDLKRQLCLHSSVGKMRFVLQVDCSLKIVVSENNFKSFSLHCSIQKKSGNNYLTKNHIRGKVIYIKFSVNIWSFVW